MRFFVTGEQNRQWIMNTIVLLFMVYMLLFAVSTALMYFDRMDLTAASVRAYYLGSEEQFTEPRSYRSLLEVSHAHLFSMGLLAVTLTHLLLFAELSARVKIGLSLAIYAGAVGDELSGWLIRFIHADFAFFKVGCFLLLELSLALLVLLVGASLIHQRRTIRGGTVVTSRQKKKRPLPSAP